MPVFESSRKVQVFGSSLAMTLPAMFAKACEIKKGSTMNVYYGLDGVLVSSRFDDVDLMKKTLEKIIEDLNRLYSDNLSDSA